MGELPTVVCLSVCQCDAGEGFAHATLSEPRYLSHGLRLRRLITFNGEGKIPLDGTTVTVPMLPSFQLLLAAGGPRGFEPARTVMCWRHYRRGGYALTAINSMQTR